MKKVNTYYKLGGVIYTLPSSLLKMGVEEKSLIEAKESGIALTPFGTLYFINKKEIVTNRLSSVKHLQHRHNKTV
jgi:hypothetical protein